MPQFKSCLVSLLSCVNFAQILNFSELWVFQQGVNNLTLDLKELEKEEQTKSRASKRKETIKIHAEINEIK